MQNQVNMNAEAGMTGSSAQPQFIIQGIPGLQGGVVNLADLLNNAAKANSGSYWVYTHRLGFILLSEDQSFQKVLWLKCVHLTAFMLWKLVSPVNSCIRVQGSPCLSNIPKLLCFL